MRSFFANIRSLTIPSTAGPGQARIVITPDLPAPLATYVFASPAWTYVGAILFYAEDPADDTYTYLAVIEESANNNTIVHMGGVANGVVEEFSAGVPMAQEWRLQTGGINPDLKTIRSDILSLFAQGIDLTAAVTTNPTQGSVDLTAGAHIRLNAQNIAALNSAVGNAFVQALAGSVTVSAGGGDVTVTASDDVTVDAGDRVTVTAPGGVHLPASTVLDYGGSTTVDGADNTAMSGTNTAYGATMTGGTAGSVLGQAFTAPPTGEVVVLYRAGMDNTTATGVAYCAPQVRAGAVVNAGALVQAANDSVALQHEGTAQRRGGSYAVVGGLTPGASYNVTLMQRSSAGANTAAFADRGVAVLPGL